MSRRPAETGFAALRVEGGLIPADELARLTTLAAADKTEQTETHYGVPRGLKLRDELARYWKIAQNLWTDFQPLRGRADVDAHTATAREFLLPLLKDVLGFTDLAPGVLDAGGRSYNVGHLARGGRLPVVLAAHSQGLDQSADRFGEASAETGRIRRRSPFLLAQEALNATDGALWAIVANGLKLRILRDNPSLTRPAYLEIDFEAIFTEDLYADFTAAWLLAHASRFGTAGAEPADCPWERWRAAGQQAGVRARDRLRDGVADALRALGTGFLRHPTNAALRAQLAEGTLAAQVFFEGMLRLVYRLIFLATVEDRTDAATGVPLVFAPGVTDEVRRRYRAGYSFAMLRERAARRSSHDRHGDLWQALAITFDGLARGEPALGLPALGGLFAPEQCPHLAAASLENRALLTAVFQLAWFREPTGLSRVNYRDMGPEELGSVYESLLELVPELRNLVHPSAATFAFAGDADEAGAATATAMATATAKGNARKLSGSYYTPDSLVQELIKSALDPVIAQTLKSHPQQPVQALLSLSVCDPACGSGHFLLAAGRRLADEVARLRAPEGNPTPADYRHALRDVVSHCLYGVDRNPMAIELARTALWLEAYTPDAPLTFLDHHIRCGDALLGVLDPTVLDAGIPDKAFDALSGDDKDVARRLKAANRAALKSLRKLKADDLFTQAPARTAALTLETLPDATLAEIEAKRRAWAEEEAARQRSKAAQLADTFVAAFVLPKTADNETAVPTTAEFWRLIEGGTLDETQRAAVHAACEEARVFHWWLEFPHIHARGGFDVMLGNPPWERIKLQEEEFFATRSPLVATSPHKAERARRIELLRAGLLLHTLYPEIEAQQRLSPPNRAEMRLHAEFIAARRVAEASSVFAHDSGRFPLTGVGDVNTYALFAETFAQAVAAQGRAGFIVPTGIATDDSTKAFFAAIIDGRRLVSLIDFRTGEGLWADIGHQRFKFCLLTLGISKQTQFSFSSLKTSEAHDPRRIFALTPDEFRLINPNTLTCPVFRSQRDAELTKKLYRATPVLIEEATETSPARNPWGIRFMAMIHMANDSGLFHDQPAPGRLPLYEAKMVHQFDHRWATYDAGGEARELTPAERADPAFTVTPHWWVDEREVLARIAAVPPRLARAWLAEDNDALRDELAMWIAGTLGQTELAAAADPAAAMARAVAKALEGTPKLNALFSASALASSKVQKAIVAAADCLLADWELACIEGAQSSDDLQALVTDWMDARSPRWLMSWRDICRATDERTVIASVVPRAAVGHTMPVMIPASYTPKSGALLGNLDSLVLDYVARQKVGGTHLTYGFFKQFPILPPDRYSPADLAFIVPRVLELTWTARDLDAWGADLADFDPRPPAQRRPFPWDPDRRALLRAELDAWYARAYGLTHDELRYILDPADVMGADYPSETFRVLKNNELKAFSEYRTRRMMLEAWDRLQTAGGADR